MKLSTLWLLGLCMVLLIVPQGALAQAPDNNDLPDTLWLLTSLTSDGTEIVPVNADITLKFEGDTVATGFSGCNTYSGNYAVEDDRIKFDSIVATLIACLEEDIMEQEGLFLESLQTTERFEVTDSTLTIWYSDGQLNFMRISELTGTSWGLASYGPPDKATDVIPDSSITLDIQQERLTGSGGCNTYGATYEINGDVLTVGEIETTEMDCQEAGIMEQERAFYDALLAAGRFEVGGDELTVWYDAEVQRLRFVRMEVTNSEVPVFEELDSPVNLLASYYNAINRGEYDRAYGYWESPAVSFDTFVSGFERTATVRLIVEPPTQYDEAVDALFANISTVLIVEYTDGTSDTFAGCFVSSRPKVAPSDSPQGQAWHLFRADIEEVTNNSDIPTLLLEVCEE